MRRHHRNRTKGRSCQGKHRFASQTAALHAAINLIDRGANRIEPYECHFCNGFHIGHTPRGKR